MPNTWITDMRHYVGSDGCLGNMPTPALNVALFLGSIVAWVTSRPSGRIGRTNVPCRRSPGRRRCLGEIHAGLDDTSDAIVWQCAVCGDRGFVSGWAGTPWDRRGSRQGGIHP